MRPGSILPLAATAIRSRTGTQQLSEVNFPLNPRSKGVVWALHNAKTSAVYIHVGTECKTPQENKAACNSTSIENIN